MQRKLVVFNYKIRLNKDLHHLEANKYKPNSFQESNFEGNMRSNNNKLQWRIRFYEGLHLRIEIMV